jgi:hypothetical protein
VQTKCADIAGNLDGTQPFNALLRVHLDIAGTTAPVGTAYTVKLLVDGSENGWYRRKLRGNYPYGDYFEGSVRNLSAAPHVFSVNVSILGPYQMTIGQVWMTAQGVPAQPQYPSYKVVSVDTIPVTPTWAAITQTISFSTTTAVDIALQGYFQINSGTAPDAVWTGFSLDGASGQRTSMVGITQSLADGIPDGANVLDYLYNVPPGNHTLTLWARTDYHSATLQFRQIEFVSFPSNALNNPAFVAGDYRDNTLTVSTQAAEEQPTGALVNPICGRWTKLLEYTIPPVSGQYNWTLEGYVQTLGGLTGLTIGDISFQILIPASNPVFESDGGFSTFRISQSPDGLYIFGDGLLMDTTSGAKVRLWIRKRNGCGTVSCPGGEPCGFTVGKRYMTTRYVPHQGCYYGSTGRNFYTLTPCRMIDTRNPNGPLGGPALAAGQTRSFTVAGQCGIPSTARAISVNATAVAPTGLGVLSFFPACLPDTGTSTLNYNTGRDRANNAVITLDSSGSLKVYCGGFGTHMVLDVNGYFQ